MPNRLRPLLLRLLLLAVCFHAAVGTALHEARHFDSLAQLAAQAPAADAGEPGESPPEEAHGLCAWCTACAAQMAQADPSPAVAPAAQTGVQRRAARQDGFTVPPLRWAFAARDPPDAGG